mgnify:CR=1 FL=1
MLHRLKIYHEYNHHSQIFLVDNKDSIGNNGIKQQVSLFELNYGNPYSYYFKSNSPHLVFYGANPVEIDSMNLSDQLTTLEGYTNNLLPKYFKEMIEENKKK